MPVKKFKAQLKTTSVLFLCFLTVFQSSFALAQPGLHSSATAPMLGDTERGSPASYLDSNTLVDPMGHVPAQISRDSNLVAEACASSGTSSATCDRMTQEVRDRNGIAVFILGALVVFAADLMHYYLLVQQSVAVSEVSNLTAAVMSAPEICDKDCVTALQIPSQSLTTAMTHDSAAGLIEGVGNSMVSAFIVLSSLRVLYSFLGAETLVQASGWIYDGAVFAATVNWYFSLIGYTAEFTGQIPLAQLKNSLGGLSHAPAVAYVSEQIAKIPTAGVATTLISLTALKAIIPVAYWIKYRMQSNGPRPTVGETTLDDSLPEGRGLPLLQDVVAPRF